MNVERSGGSETTRNKATCQVRENAKEHFPSIYLTLISIIQSLAFGDLLSKAAEKGLWGVQNASETGELLKVIAVGVLILYVWHEYVVGLIALTWVIGLLDSIIPLAFGFAQFLMIESLGQDDTSSWFRAFFIFLIVSFVSYANMYYKARKEKDNQAVLATLGRWKTMTLLFLAFMMAFAFAAAYFLSHSDGSSPICLMVATLILLLLFGARGVVMWRKLVHLD